MSQQSLNQFLEQVCDEETLGHEFEKALVQGDVAVAAVVTLGARHGHQFTSDEFVERVRRAHALRNGAELTDDELDAVAGGGNLLSRKPDAMTATLQGFENPIISFENPIISFEDPLTARPPMP